MVSVSAFIKNAYSLGLCIATLAFLGHLVNDTYSALLNPLGPELQHRYGISIGHVALLGAIFSFTGAFLQPLLGIVGEHLDRRLMMAFGPALTGLGLSLIGEMPNFFILIVLVATAGLGSGFFHPAAAAYVSEFSPQNRRGLWASWFSAGGTLGMSLGPWVSTLGLSNLTWTLPVGLLLGVLSYFLTPSRPNHVQRRSTKDYIQVFQGPLVTLWGMAVLRSLTSITYGSLLPFTLREKHFGPHDTAWTLGIMALGTTIGGILGGRLSDKKGRTWVLRGSIGLVIPLYVVLIFSSPQNLWFYPLGFLVAAVANASIPVGVVTAQEYQPKQLALASSIMMGFSWGTAGILYWPMGILADHFGTTEISLLGVGFLFPSMFLASHLPEPNRNT